MMLPQHIQGWWFGWFTVVLIALVIALVTMPATGQANGDLTWTPIGPDGGTMFEITADPTNSLVLFARSVTGISRTTNGGATWELVAPYYEVRGRDPILIDPTNPALLVTLLEGGDLLRSTDGGSTWSEQALTFHATSFAFDAVGGGVLWATGDEELYRSVNGGTNWTQVSFPTNELVASVMAHPTLTNKIYVRTVQDDLFVSTDGGATWAERSYIGGFALEAIDPTNNTIYAIWKEPTNAQGVIKSTNDGVSWSDFDTGLFPWITSLVIDPNNSTRLYATSPHQDIYRTTSDGTAWEPTNSDFPSGTSTNGGQLAITTDAPATLYYADYGVYQSEDGADTWEFRGSGISGQDFSDFEIDPTTPARLYATNGGYYLYKSDDGGITWATMEPAFGVLPNVVVNAPSNPAVMYLGTLNDGVYRSTNGGTTWVAANTGTTPNYYVSEVAVASDDPNHLLAAYEFGQLYRSVNGGTSWNLVYDHDYPWIDIVFAPGESSMVWATTPNQILKSTDGGATWMISPMTGLPGNSRKYTIAVHPTNSNELYLSTMSTTSGDLYRSTDGGVTWNPLPTGLPADARVADIWIDPATPDTMLIAANQYIENQLVPYGYGVYRSINGGDSWQAINEGLHHRAIQRLVGSGDTVFGSAFFGGVWRLGDAPVPITPTPSTTSVPTTTPTATPTGTPFPPDAICSTVNAPIETGIPLIDLIFPGTSAVVTDMDLMVVVEHPAVGELEYALFNSERTVSLFQGASCSGNDIHHRLDDEGDTAIAACGDDPSPAYPAGAWLIPAESLSAFDGDLLNDAWHFSIVDNTTGNTGTLVEWCLVPSLAPVPTITAMPGTITATPTATATATLHPTVTSTATGTPTIMPGTITATPTATPTGIAPTATSTPTATLPVPPTEDTTLYLPFIQMESTAPFLPQRR